MIFYWEKENYRCLFDDIFDFLTVLLLADVKQFPSTQIAMNCHTANVYKSQVRMYLEGQKRHQASLVVNTNVDSYPTWLLPSSASFFSVVLFGQCR